MCSNLDFSDVNTWKNIDIFSACIRMSGSDLKEEYFNPGAAVISKKVFEILEDDQKNRARFFLNCEKFGYRGKNLYSLYKDEYENKYPEFIKAILELDKNTA